MKHQRLLLALILTVYLLLALGSGALNPVFEAPDEIWHYFTAQTIAETRRLPSVEEEPDLWMSQEAAQPPLYYVISAALISPIDTSQARELVWANPAVQLGDASSPTNTNAFVHTGVESWPWQGYSLAVHVARILSTVLGLGTLLAIYGSGRLVWPDQPSRALLATSMVAFLPQFVFLHSSVSNDTLIIFLCSASLWQLLHMWYHEMTWPRLLLLGLTLGLAILSKTAGLLLLFYGLGFVALLAWRSARGASAGRIAQKMLGAVLSVFLLAMAVGGWLLWRNWQLYGDITAANQFIRFAGGDRGYSLIQAFRETGGLWRSFFAVFGWFNVLAPSWIYVGWNGIVVAAIIGAVIRFWSWLKRRREGLTATGVSEQGVAPVTSTILDHPAMPAALLGLWVLLVYAGLINFMLRTPAAQGRLLFPALLPLALALVYGLSRYRWRGIYLIAPLLALITTIYSVAVVIPEAYARPAVVTEAAIPAGATRYDADLGQGLLLVAAEVQTETAKPGDWVEITLYWQAQQVPEGAAERQAPQFVLELYGQDLELAGKLQSYHGGGLYPSSLWTEGEIIVDRPGVRIDKEATVPALARAFVRLADPDGAVEVGAIKIVPAEWPPVTDEILAKIEGIELVEVQLDPTNAAPGDTVSVNLRWQVTSAPGRDLTTFVHLGDPSADTSLPPLAQGDSPPLGGYYPTSSWSPGEVIDDHYSLTLPADLPPGRYPIYVGLYDPGTGTRAVLELDGQRQANDAFLVGWLSIDG